MITPQSLLANILWLFGLSGVLATFSYFAWYRKQYDLSWRALAGMPRLLAPLSLALTAFCTGMAWAGAVDYQAAPWWQTIAWTVLAILFVVQLVLYVRAGRQTGWDNPVEENKEP
jgi:phosphoglycerol transferase MdoB-like AlkP superfamily enzyme